VRENLVSANLQMMGVLSRATFYTAALFISSSCNIVSIAIEVEQRVGALLQSRTRIIVPPHQMNPINGIEYERVTG